MTLKTLFLIAMLAGCSSPALYVYEPMRGEGPSSKDDLYARAMSVMNQVGLTIETNDPAAGIVVSDWRCDAANLNEPCLVQYRYAVEVADGAYQVTIQCQEQPAGYAAGAYQPCSMAGYPRPWLETQHVIATAMGQT